MDINKLSRWVLIMLVGFCVFASVTYGVLAHRAGGEKLQSAAQSTAINQTKSQAESDADKYFSEKPLAEMGSNTEFDMHQNDELNTANNAEFFFAAQDTDMSEQVSGGNQLSPAMLETLLLYDWMDRVVSSRGVWVCVQRQMMYILDGLELVWQAPVATGATGTGFVWGSNQTPLGWHRVDEKFGDNAPWGQIFRARGRTAQIWQPGDDVEEDLVLTRILWLEGEEPGVNRGYNAAGELVDSKRRYIYIHGTNGEADIGTPSSHGCIRMLNDDVILAYDMIPVGTPVLITE